jgi:hypothetical protein
MPAFLEHGLVVEVNAGHSVVALGGCGLLLDADHALTVELSYAKAACVLDSLQEDLGALLLGTKVVGSLADTLLEDVVAQDDAD